MSTRDELATVIESQPALLTMGNDQQDRARSVEIADAILAAGYTKIPTADYLRAAGWVKPRTIITVEELDALAVGAVVRTAGDEDKFDPRVAIKTATLGPHSYWAVAGDEDGFESMSDELDDLPATVLYEPAP